jgi:hypothetical protein
LITQNPPFQTSNSATQRQILFRISSFSTQNLNYRRGGATWTTTYTSQTGGTTSYTQAHTGQVCKEIQITKRSTSRWALNCALAAGNLILENYLYTRMYKKICKQKHWIALFCIRNTLELIYSISSQFILWPLRWRHFFLWTLVNYHQTTREYIAENITL